MNYATEPRPFTPDDPEVGQRMARLRELNLESRPYSDFDELAAKIAVAAGASDGYAMINFIGPTEQYFAGLYMPSSTSSGASQQAATVATEQQERVMDRDHGFCPHVVVRRKALVLEDICEYARFAGNPVVDELCIRSYLGAPLIDRTGVALGTICVVATEPHRWGHQGLETIKKMADRVIAHIHEREKLA